MANKKKFKKSVEGDSPYLDITYFIFFMTIWLYGIYGFKDINLLLYLLGMLGSTISAIRTISSFALREVYWVEVK